MDFTNLIPDLELPEIQVDINQEKIDTTPTEVTASSEEKIAQETSNQGDDVALAFYEQLKDRGYYVNEEFKGTWEELDDYFDNLPQMVLNSVVETLPEVSKSVLQFIASAGDNITIDEMKNFFQTYFKEQTEDVNLDSNDSAREFLENYYKENGIKPKAITAMLDNLEDDDELISTAKEEYEKLKSSSKQTDKLINDKKEETTARKQEQQQFVNQVQTELTNTGWKPERIKTISSILSGNNLVTKLQEVYSNPKGIVQLADLLSYVDKGEFNLENYKKQAETKTAQTLKERLQKSQFSSSSLRTNQTSNFEDESMILEPILD